RTTMMSDSIVSDREVMEYVILTMLAISALFFFFYTAAPPTEIYTLSLHDALPIFSDGRKMDRSSSLPAGFSASINADAFALSARSEEHTSELQSLRHLVCRLLLEKKKLNPMRHRARVHPCQRVADHRRVGNVRL